MIVSIPNKVSTIYQNLFYYPGTVPLSSIANHLASQFKEPKPILLFSLERDSLVCNVLELSRGDQKKFREKLYPGCILTFFSALDATPYQLTLQSLPTPSTPAASTSTSTNTSPSSQPYTASNLNSETLIYKLELLDYILATGRDGEGSGIQVLSERDGGAKSLREKVERRLWELEGRELEFSDEDEMEVMKEEGGDDSGIGLSTE